MTALLSELERIAQRNPDAPALSEEGRSLSWSGLMQSVANLAENLSPYQGEVVALLADNGIDWVLVDLACLKAGISLLPLPGFFSEQQRQHAIRQSAAVALISPSNPESSLQEPLTDTLSINKLPAGLFAELPWTTSKITFTSGSTGQPKGVCLSEDNQLKVAQSLLERTGLNQARHLCVLPLSTLLENIAGVYAPLLSGGEVVLRPAAELGFNGSRGFDIQRLVSTIDKVQPNSLILLPELLSALLIAIKHGWKAPQSLQFVAVGGSRVAPGLVKQARAAGLPVYEGYGLSECSSVVSLNSTDADFIGATGKILSHITVTIEDGEVVVTGNAFLGYVNEPETWYAEKVYTGDMGKIDEHGFLHIQGRRKNLLISSFGRNINPEWIESEVLANPAIAQCVVFGDARPFCIAIIQTRQAEVPDELIDDWLEQVNQDLPDYAQIVQWHRLDKPLSQAQGTLTASGKPVRKRIEALYSEQINHLFKELA